jgi:hypothetical protein
MFVCLYSKLNFYRWNLLSLLILQSQFVFSSDLMASGEKKAYAVLLLVLLLSLALSVLGQTMYKIIKKLIGGSVFLATSELATTSPSTKQVTMTIQGRA